MRPEQPASEGQAQTAGCQGRGSANGGSGAATSRGAVAQEGSPPGARGRAVSAGPLQEQVLSLRAQVRSAITAVHGRSKRFRQVRIDIDSGA